MFLQEAEATVLVFDLRGFSRLAASLGPIDLGAALSRFYQHCETCVVAHAGRMVKFLGDGVLACWLSSEVEDFRRKAVAAVWESHRKRAAWVQKGVDEGFPMLDYSVAAATGPVLVGHIGTDRLKQFDVLGESVNIARKLTGVATARGVDHLVTHETLDSPAGRLSAVEVEGIELGGKALRLFRLD
jgi:adenylate cyclase